MVNNIDIGFVGDITRSIFLLCHLFFEEGKFTYFLQLGNT